MLNLLQGTATRIAALVTLLFLVFMCGWLPGKLITYLHRGLDNSLDLHRLQQILTGMNCFAGGVFLATCLLDLFPDFRRLVARMNKELESAKMLNTELEGDTMNTKLRKEGTNMNNSTNIMNNNIEKVPPTDSRVYAYRQRTLVLPKLSQTKDTEVQPTSFEGERQFVHDTPLNRLRRHSSLKASSRSNGYITETEDPPQTEQKSRSLEPSVIALLLILSVHCIFDGLTVGLEPQPPTQALEVTVAVAIHKCVFAFSLGVQYAQRSQMGEEGLNRSVLCYTAASPVGIFMALVFEIIATNLVNLQAMLGSVLPAIATGTLAFKTFLDITPATCQKT